MNSTEVDVDVNGDPDQAGFVQVILGQNRDPDRARALMSQDSADWAGFRPDIIGSLVVAHEGGRYTMALYFTSEEAAREGERKEPPAEQKAQMRRWTRSVSEHLSSSTSERPGCTHHLSTGPVRPVTSTPAGADARRVVRPAAHARLAAVGHSAGEPARVAGEAEVPACWRVHRTPHRRSTVCVALEVSVFELDTRTVLRLRDEATLTLLACAGRGRIYGCCFYAPDRDRARRLRPDGSVQAQGRGVERRRRAEPAAADRTCHGDLVTGPMREPSA